MITIDNLKDELRGKERSVVDLARYLGTRNEETPNYSLLLGAGCSVTSGIRTAESLVEMWRREIYLGLNGLKEEDYNPEKAKAWLSKEQASWYNPSKEYSSLFERKYDLPKQRRMFVEQQVSDAFPSIGYAYLMNLVSQNYINTIFTTNFDDLISEAFYQFSKSRPIICAHDSSINSITVTSKRPKIIKLHGDYLFDDIKSTLRETESLEENMRNKFIEFSKEYGLIAIGYSGGDRSIMDVLFHLLKSENYFKHGIYWCMRRGSHVSDDLRKLLWRDRVYFVIIDGFDEVLAELKCLMMDNNLPVETDIFSNKLSSTIKKFTDNSFLEDTKSPYIRAHLQEMKRDQNSNLLFSTLKELSGLGDKEASSEDDINNDELFTLLSIDRLVKRKQYDQAVNQAKSKLNEYQSNDFSERLWLRILEANEAMQNIEEAINACEELVKLNGNNPNYAIKKAELTKDLDSKIEIIETAISQNLYIDSLFEEKARYLIEKSRYLSGASKDDALTEIDATLNSSIEKYPDIDNPSWITQFHFIKDNEPDNQNRRQRMEEIISLLTKQNAHSHIVSELTLEYCKHFGQDEFNGRNLIDLLTENRNKHYPRYEVAHLLCLIKACSHFDLETNLKNIILEADSIKKVFKNPRYILSKAEAFLDKFRDLPSAIRLLEENKDNKNSPEIIHRLCDYYILANRVNDAEELLRSHENLFSSLEKTLLRCSIHEVNGEFKKAISCYETLSSDRYFLYKYSTNISYLYLCLQAYDKARKTAKDLLDKVNFDTARYQAQIINYEYACCKTNKNIHRERLQTLYDHPDSEDIKAVACLLLGDKDEAISLLRKSVQKTYSCIFNYLKWPVLESIRSEIKQIEKDFSDNQELDTTLPTSGDTV